ncbi:hypothetical protein N7528_000051 [Penicillium herquei]|nr:hypothetical protein N7528_000051 [Penicillium herquei]
MGREAMEHTRSWFSQGPFKDKYVPTAIISTQNPVPRKWKILRVIKEQNEQEHMEKDRIPFTTIRLECRQEDNRAPPSLRAEIRVYLQVPYASTEFQAPALEVDELQAMDFQPNELSAYKIMSSDEYVSAFTPKLLGYEQETQDNSGFIPGGFHVTIAWEILPGVRLGVPDLLAEHAFWKLDRYHRDKIRTQLKDQFMHMKRLGVWPADTAITNLLYDKPNGRLYWVNFYDADFAENVTWNDAWFVSFGLAIPPEDDVSWSRSDWNHDTSGWRV